MERDNNSPFANSRFFVNDCVVWKNDIVAAKLRYNKSKNKNKSRMYDQFDVPMPHAERWPMGFMYVIGYDSESWDRVAIVDRTFRKTKSGMQIQYVSVHIDDLELATDLYGKDMETPQTLLDLGF